jgi:hypothetical protein
MCHETNLVVNTLFSSFSRLVLSSLLRYITVNCSNSRSNSTTYTHVHDTHNYIHKRAGTLYTSAHTCARVRDTQVHVQFIVLLAITTVQNVLFTLSLKSCTYSSWNGFLLQKHNSTLRLNCNIAYTGDETVRAGRVVTCHWVTARRCHRTWTWTYLRPPDHHQ